jgi:hypothetical protein
MRKRADRQDSQIAAWKLRPCPLCRHFEKGTGLQRATSGVTGQFDGRKMNHDGCDIPPFICVWRSQPTAPAWLQRRVFRDVCCPFAAPRNAHALTRRPCASPRGGSLRREVAVEVGGGNPAVHEEVAAGDEGAVAANEKCADGSDFVLVLPRPAGQSSIMRRSRRREDRSTRPWRAGEDDAGTDRVDPGPSLPPANGLSHHAQPVPALGELVGHGRRAGRAPSSSACGELRSR